jgi:hypothetical protein
MEREQRAAETGPDDGDRGHAGVLFMSGPLASSDSMVRPATFLPYDIM